MHAPGGLFVWLFALQSAAAGIGRRNFLGGLFSGSTAAAASKDADNNNSSDHKDSNKSLEGSWMEGMEFKEYKGEGQKTETLKSDDVVLSDFQLHPMLQIPLSLALESQKPQKPNWTPVRTFCDTAATRTCLTRDAAQRLNLLRHVDRRYAQTTAVGVGTRPVLGRVPAGVCLLNLHGQVQVPCPAMVVLDDMTESSAAATTTDEVELLLGLDFLREYQAILDLRQEELRLLVKGDEHSIPFVRPRGRGLLGLDEDPSEAAASDKVLLSNSDCKEADEDEDDSEDESSVTSRGIDMSGM